jgi:chromosome segregation ATPase
VLEEKEKDYEEKKGKLEEEIQRLTKELEGQEGKYNAKVKEVKDEHEQKLQEAFERAKIEAGSAHGDELQILRAQSQASIDQLRASQESTVNSLKAEHAAELDAKVKALEKKLASQALELQATQDDLGKAKAAVAATKPEIDSLKAQLEEAARKVESAKSSASANVDADYERMKSARISAEDDLAAMKEALTVTQESIVEMTTSHGRELEQAAQARVEERNKLQAEHAAAAAAFEKEKQELLARVSDLEGEVSTLKADVAAAASAAPKTNGKAPAPAAPQESMEKLHEAHTLKIKDLTAAYEKQIKALQEEREEALSQVDGLKADVARKAMEVQYLEQEQEENQEETKRLEEELAELKSQLQAASNK